MATITPKKTGGPFMFIHEVTGTYIETDNYNDNVNEAIQTWNLSPLMTAKGYPGHLWYLKPFDGGAYLIKTFENGRCLTASATSATDFPRLQEKDGGIRQQWTSAWSTTTSTATKTPTRSSPAPTRATPWRRWETVP
ncbi:RICIN domain-containing protein [Streptomyces sp. NPDC001410]|uniref:RICIN domain-containing protein n=1 Tax=Streptomyces sp. NPDC001410 TaxID=3364574 RepID=UPI0036AD2282